MTDNLVNLHCAPEGGQRPKAVSVPPDDYAKPARYAHTRWRMPEGTGAFVALWCGIALGFMAAMWAPPSKNECLSAWGRMAVEVRP